MNWIENAIFYHIYPLGFCGAPLENDMQPPKIPRLSKILEWSEHIQSLHVNAIYLGPLFESKKHGYDTTDYFEVDRRLGDNNLLREIVGHFHGKGIKIVLDAVLNHVGRDFWAFRDVLIHGEKSLYCNWFSGLRFDVPSPLGDPFCYDTWNGHCDLVKLNLENDDVINHLLQAVKMWIEEFDIDGLRLDAADSIEISFLQKLKKICVNKKSDFWLMGEVVHGDYRKWANEQTLHSVTNYEIYKGLYSSLNDKNYFEIAYSLNRQFGQGGMYQNLLLYNFADNHDVHRVASALHKAAHLYPLYILLFTIPGVPSIYYGSEFGMEGRRSNGSDLMLRPAIDLGSIYQDSVNRDIIHTIRKLAAIRLHSDILKYGDYQTLHISHELFAFKRSFQGQIAVVIVNASSARKSLRFNVDIADKELEDILNENKRYFVKDGELIIYTIHPHWGCLLLLSD